GVGGVDVDVEHVVALDADHAVAVGLGKGAHLGGAGPVLLVDQELGAVAVLDVLHLHQVIGKDAAAGVGGGQLGLVLGGLGGGDDALAVEHLAHALEDDQDALAPGVHHAGLFQDGQQVGGVVQGALAGGQDQVPQLVHVGDAAGPGLLRGDAGHRQDGALGGLHDGLIGGLDALFQGGDQVPGAGLFFAFQRFGKAAEQQAGDDARVAPRPPQHGGGGGLGGLAHGAVVGQGVQLGHRRADGHPHVGAGIAVRHGEHVQLVHAGALVVDVV